MDILDTLRNYFTHQYRKENCTFREFAQKHGMTQPGLSMFLQGKRGMTLTMLERIATAQGLEPWQLLKRAEVNGKKSNHYEKKREKNYDGNM